jgi:alkanesulfonate monooxygenase SsuD/methylene tetrahydromethanopterin reductase-like flavin-dependent oxidoreductase (luciferase family)
MAHPAVPSTPMKVGVVLPIAQDDGDGRVPSYGEIRTMALVAEEEGFDSIWVYDHLLYRFDGEETGIHECWTILSALAEATRTVTLGTIVMCTAFRNPALLAKMAATLDHISGGRLILGVGCGWHDPEYEAFGYPTDHKVGRFEEALTVIRDLIREGRADLAGRWVTATDAALLPPARPDLPILIAAKRPRMLELTARHADAWNLAWFGEPDERWTAGRDALLAACAAVGRDPATVERTVGLTVRFPDLLRVPPVPPAEGAKVPPALEGSVEEVAAGLRAYADEGTGHAIVALEPMTPDAVRRLAEAMRLARG